MPVDPSNIHGRDPSGNTRDVNVDALGNLGISGTVSNSSTAVISSVIATTSFGVLQAANTGRKGLIVYSCSGSVSPALVAYTTAASAINFSVAMNPGAYWEMPPTISTVGMSIGVATAASTGPTATVLVTELS